MSDFLFSTYPHLELPTVQMKEVKEEKSHSKNLTEKLQAAITYYENHQHQMDYAEYLTADVR